jgi:anti-sigma regulatory factor (Ser/Thr protein kinase)
VETKLVVSESSQVAQARRQVLAVCAASGFTEEIAGKAALVVTEAATNLVKYAGGGEMIIRAYSERGTDGVEILALDSGPGIDDLPASLSDGHSTGGTLGLGMGAIGRLSSQSEVYSIPGGGTALWARVAREKTVYPARNPAHELVASGIATPKPGQEACGDMWTVKRLDGTLWAAVIDGLGHGPQAAIAAAEAVRTFHGASADTTPQELLQKTHVQLKGTRGAVMAVAAIRPALGLLEFAGIGNITAVLIGHDGTRRLSSMDGTLGYSVRMVRQHTYPWEPGSALVLTSDGISTRWNLLAHPGLSLRHPSLMAAVLHRDFGRLNDDATVVVVKEA